MSYSIRFVVEALKKTTGKTAKLKLIIRKDKNRVPKTYPYSVNTKDWDKNRQRLKSSSSLAVELNPLLDAIQGKLEKQILLWEKEGLNWSPKELRDTLDDKKPKESQKSSLEQSFVEYWINYQIHYFSTIERSKNGKIIIGSSNADNYQWLKNSLLEFTRSKYKKEFAKYRFNDITEAFLRSYSVYIQQKGYSNGNKGGLSHKLKNLKAVFNVASKQGIKGINTNVFEVASNHMKATKTTPKTTSKANLQLIQNFDRKLLTKKESFWLDLFLFSYYAGGMANVDVCYLNQSCLKGDYIEYTRHKCDRVANPAFLPQMKEIIDRYSSDTYADYVLPIFNEKQQTELQKRQKVDRINLKVNKTLRRICTILNISDKITWYSARGTYITDMINSGINSHMVADQAGNSVKIIEKHYYHIADRESLLDKIASVI